MDDYNLMICRTCKTANWYSNDELPGYIEDHMGHLFTIMTPTIFGHQGDFCEWFLDFMGWSEEAEG